MSEQVIVVGGGAVGLVSSIYLSLLGVEHVLYERFPATTVHPKATGLNQRTLEIFRVIGIEEEARKLGSPYQGVPQTAWYTSLGPTKRTVYKRDFFNRDVLMSGKAADLSPSQHTLLAQTRFEPLLLARAKELNPEGIVHNAEVIKVTEEDDGVIVTTKLRLDGATKTVKARYVVACDGGRTVADSLGMKTEGIHNFMEMLSVHFKAPLSMHIDRDIAMAWFINPELGGSLGCGYLYHLGPYPISPETEEWVFQAGALPGDPKVFDKDAMIARISKTLQIDNLKVDVLSLSSWTVCAVIAERYRSPGGRVFVAGDAAHRFPPWGALGVNTGIQDVPNLIWRLAYVIKDNPEEIQKDQRYHDFLSGYEEERKPVGQRAVNTSFSSFCSHSTSLDDALGVSMENTAEENWKALEQYMDSSSPESAKIHADVEKVQRALDPAFNVPGDDGYFYPSLDLDGEAIKALTNGQIQSDGKIKLATYIPSTLPGHQLPHVWLKRGGKLASTRDLVRLDRCVLITMNPFWEEYKSEILAVEVLGGKDGWEDFTGKWILVQGVELSGGVIVRPDGFVVLRKQTSSGVGSPSNFKADLARALKLPIN